MNFFRTKLHLPSKRGMIGIILISVIALVAVAIYYFFFRGSAELRAARKDFDITTQAVGKLMELPDEVPVLATVTDLEKLKGQPFFDEAQNGDKVLVFNVARKVVLYRPSTKKIVNFSNLNPSDLKLDAQPPVQAAPVTTPTPASDESSKPVTIAIYNGTAIAGLTQKVQQKIQAATVSAEVISRGNAGQTNYEKTLIIPLTPAGETQAPAIVELLGGKLSTVPEGETTVVADILIIAGADAIAR